MTQTVVPKYDDNDDGRNRVELASSSPKRVITNDPDFPRPQEMLDNEIGVRLNLPFNQPYKNQWEVLRHDEVSVDKLVTMRRTDGQAVALYRLMTIPILSSLMTATFVPASNVEGGEEEAKFVEQMFTLPRISGGMETSFKEVMAQMLLALFDGFSAFEVVVHSPEVGPLKGKYTLKKLAHRPSETVSFVVDDKGDWTGLRQRATVNGKLIDEFIERNRAIYLAVNEDQRPMYGVSYFHAAFFHWDKKVRLYYLAHLMAQRSAVGTRVGKYPADKADPRDVADFGKQLSNMATNNWMRIPTDYEVDSLHEGGQFDFLGLINHHNAQMSKSVLASFFDQNQGAGQGDQTLVDFGQESDALFIMLLESIVSRIQDIINHEVIPQFINWNFGNDKYPEIHFGSLSNDKRKSIIQMFQAISIAANQGNMTPDFAFNLEKMVSDSFGLPIDYDTIAKEREEQKEREKKQQEEMAAAQQQGADPVGGTPDPTAVATPGQPGVPATAASGNDISTPSDLLPPGFQ